MRVGQIQLHYLASALTQCRKVWVFPNWLFHQSGNLLALLDTGILFPIEYESWGWGLVSLPPLGFPRVVPWGDMLQEPGTTAATSPLHFYSLKPFSHPIHTPKLRDPLRGQKLRPELPATGELQFRWSSKTQLSLCQLICRNPCSKICTRDTFTSSMPFSRVCYKLPGSDTWWSQMGWPGGLSKSLSNLKK